jgi:SnoaL-like protein
MSDAAEDILAIQDLLSKYGLYLDEHDMESWGALFAPDAEMHAFRQTWHGPEIVERIAQADPGLHMAGVPSVELDGDRARARQSFLFVEGVGHRLRLGMYVDELVRLAEGWRFASRRIVFMKSTPPGAVAQPDATT